MSRKVCEFCEGYGKLGFQQETCCYCDGKGFIESEGEINDKSVDFITAIKSGKNIKVEHKYIKNLGSCNLEDIVMEDMVKALNNGDYMNSNEILCALGWMTSSSMFNEIMLNGKWYIKE